jgi:heterodisulfide reductase subunit A
VVEVYVKGKGEWLVEVKGSTTKTNHKKKISKKTKSPRIGLIICNCGGQISEKIDISILIKKSKNLKYVTNVKQTANLCSRKGISQIKKDFRGCDRLLVAGCSERSSLTFTEDRISALLEEMGINKALFEVANIREQCAWIHDGNVTGKAMDVINMAHTKLLLNVPSPAPAKIAKKSIVIGGGPAGLQAAVDLANAGTEVVLVEKKAYLGGHFCQIPYLAQCEGWPAMCVSDCVSPVQARKAVFHPLIQILTSSEVTDIERENGNFKIRINKGAEFIDADRCVSCGKCSIVCPIEVKNEFEYGLTRRRAIDKEYKLAIPDTYTLLKEVCTKCGQCLKVCPTNAINLDAEPKVIEDIFGTVILATGFDSIDLNTLEEMNYASPNVISSMEMERLIAARLQLPDRYRTLERIVFVLCTGSRATEKKIPKGMPYCSKTCCSIAVKQANRVMALKPDADVSIVYFGDIRTYERAFEEFYREGKNLVDFINGEVTRVEDVNGGLKLYIENPERELKEIDADLIVLAEALIPKGIELIRKLKIKTDRYDYPLEIQPRILRPTESFIDRVYIAGAVNGPKIVQESVEQGSTAALKALYHISKGAKELPKFISEVNTEYCSSCRICEAVCPHGAIRFTENGAEIDQAFCFGCGLCASSCPSHAIQLINFTDKQILRQVEVAFSESQNDEPRILGLLCYWCSYASADLIGINGLKLPVNFRSIRIRCSSSVHSGLILEIFKRGVDGVIIAGCPPKNCHHGSGNYMTAKRVMLLNMLMRQLGLGTSRLRWEYIGVPMWRDLAKTIEEMDRTLKTLGPNPIGKVT